MRRHDKRSIFSPIVIPPFARGGLLPPGRYLATLQDVEDRLVVPFSRSATRSVLYAGWRERRAELLSLVPIEMEWIDGSFVTAKWDAGDIDVVSFIKAGELQALDASARQRVAELSTGVYPRIVYGCHTFVSVIYPATQGQAHERHLRERGYWDRLWGRDKLTPARTKGYIEVRETR